MYTREKSRSRSDVLAERVRGRPGAARANLPQRRVDDREGPSRVIRTRPVLTPAAAPAITAGPLLGVEAPQAEEKANEDGASNQGQQENRQRLLHRENSEERCDRAHCS
jgi:hypothetical protein